MEKVAHNTYKHDSKVADDHIRKRFDLRNFPEVEVLSNVRLDQDVYKFLQTAKKELDAIDEAAEHDLRDAFISVGMKFDDYYDFATELTNLYLDHIDSWKEQVAFFNMSFTVDDDGTFEGTALLTRTESVSSDRDISPRTPSSVFCIRTNEEIALDYDYAVQTGTTSTMQSRFIDMFNSAMMNVVLNFEKNCVLEEERKDSATNGL